MSGWSDNPGVCGESPEEREARLEAERERREKEEAEFLKYPEPDPSFFEKFSLKLWFAKKRIVWFFERITSRRKETA